MELKRRIHSAITRRIRGGIFINATDFIITAAEIANLQLEGQENPMSAASAEENQAKFDALPKKIAEKHNGMATALEEALQDNADTAKAYTDEQRQIAVTTANAYTKEQTSRALEQAEFADYLLGFKQSEGENCSVIDAYDEASQTATFTMPADCSGICAIIVACSAPCYAEIGVSNGEEEIWYMTNFAAGETVMNSAFLYAHHAQAKAYLSVMTHGLQTVSVLTEAPSDISVRFVYLYANAVLRAGKGENSVETGFQTNSWGDNTFSEGRGTYPLDDADLNITPDMTDEEIIALFKRTEPRKKFALNREPAGHNEGSSNLQLGDSGHTEGAGNINTANCGHVENQTNENYAMNGHVQGTENVLEEEAENGSVGGSHNRGKSKNGTIFGQYNTPKTNTLLEIGCGTSDTDRKNAVEVKKDGKFAMRHGATDMNGKPLLPATMPSAFGFLKAEADKTYPCSVIGTGTVVHAGGVELNRLRVSMSGASFDAISSLAVPLVSFLYTEPNGKTRYISAQVLAVSARDDSGYNLDFDKNAIDFATGSIEPYQYAERLKNAVVYTASAAWVPFSETVLPQVNAKALQLEIGGALQKACVPTESPYYADGVYTQTYTDLVQKSTEVIVACGTNDTQTNRIVVTKADFPQISTAWDKRKLRFIAADGSVAVEDIVLVTQRADGNYNINYTTNVVAWNITKEALTEQYATIAVTGSSAYGWETKEAFLQEVKSYTDEAIQKAILDSWEVAI